MFNLLTKNQVKPNFEANELDVLLAKIAQIYRVDDIDTLRKSYLTDTINKYGYLPYPHYKALQELTSGEAIFCLIKKLEKSL